jgi:hypothetical protein
MRRITLAVLFAFGLFAENASASILILLRDEFDDSPKIIAAANDPAVKTFRADLDALKDRLRLLKERDVIALFGKSVPKPAKTFAMPVGQPRGLGLSGLRYTDPKKNKDHTEFYRIGDTAGLKIYYALDGVTPMAIVVYFRADNSFPKLTRDNLKDRLAWDRMRLRQLTDHLDRRRAAVFVWEVDPQAEKMLYRDDFSRDPKAKLAAWKASARKLGLRYQYDSGSNHHRWYRPDGTLAREAYAGDGPQKPAVFIWRHKDGQSELRSENSGNLTIHRWRWCRPGTTYNIRYETGNSSGRPDHWSWYDRNGKLIRSEWDSNGDGVPDRVAEDPEGKASNPLRVEQSWAVHPRLIPNECRIPDQPERRVPLRRIVLQVKKD